MKNKISQIILILIIISSNYLFANTYYVSKTGRGIYPYETWDSATYSIQSAIDVASSNDIVFVNDGTYEIYHQLVITNDIILKSVHGAEKTIIANDRPIYWKERCIYINANCVIDGFTISNGFARYYSGAPSSLGDMNSGGGIYCINGSINNCVIVGNTATNDGGGVYCENSTINNCKIIKNFASGYEGDSVSGRGRGGGVYCKNSTIIKNSTINDNILKTHDGYRLDGGGIYCTGGTVLNCTIKHNKIDNAYLYNGRNRGGGICCFRTTVKNCLISQNISRYVYYGLSGGYGSQNYGGGIYCYNYSTIQNCTIKLNSIYSLNYYKNDIKNHGGGVYSSEGIIENCIIVANNADARYNYARHNLENDGRLENYGGGVYCYGSIIRNNIINNNSLNDVGISGRPSEIYGNGVYCNQAMIQNCTISGNISENYGGIYCYNYSTIQNSIVWNNADGYNFIESNTSNVYNCIENWTNLVNCIITNNPKFISSTNFSLQSTSPCRNSGTNLSYVFETFDIVESPRTMAYTVDMGAYEYVETIHYPPSISTPQIDDSDIDYGIINYKTPYAEKYTLQEQFNGTNGNWTTIYNGTNSSFIIQRITNAYYRIIAYNNYGTSTWSDIYLSSAYPIILSLDNANIIWDDVIKATKYNVEKKSNNNWYPFYETTFATAIVDRTDSAYYRVAVANNALQSKWSSSIFYTNYPLNTLSLSASQIQDGSGYVSIRVTLTDKNLDLTKLKVEYSLNNGASWVNGDPFLVSVIQRDQTPSINNSLEYQVNNIMPNNKVITLLWDTISTQNGKGSLANQRIYEAKIKVTPRNDFSQGYFYNSYDFRIDNTVVSNYWLVINNNDSTTATPNVSLQIHAEGTYPIYMRISNGPNFGNSEWVTYKTNCLWQLTPGYGNKVVYIQFKNVNGIIPVTNDTIVLENYNDSNFSKTNSEMFLMGRDNSFANEAPTHYVNLTKISMYKTEISNLEFERFVKEGGYYDKSYWSEAGWMWRTTNNIVCPLYWSTNDTPYYKNTNLANSPVVGISYYEAEAYVNWADYELPTEAEWEYFAKGNDERHYPWADDFWYTSSQPYYYLCNWKIEYQGYNEAGFTSDGAEYTTNVISYSPGKGHLGNYNLSGNVAEWVYDWYGNYASGNEIDPKGPNSGMEKVVRGGSFVHGRDDLTTTRRMHYSPEFRTNWLGMRVAKNNSVPEPTCILFLINLIIFIRKK